MDEGHVGRVLPVSKAGVEKPECCDHSSRGGRLRPTTAVAEAPETRNEVSVRSGLGVVGVEGQPRETFVEGGHEGPAAGGWRGDELLEEAKAH